MELYRIFPVVIHFFVLLRVGLDYYSVSSGFVSKEELAGMTAFYDKVLYLLMATIIVSLLIKDSRLRLLSIVTGALAFAAIWVSGPYFTPEYHTTPLYVPDGRALPEDEEE